MLRLQSGNRNGRKMENIQHTAVHTLHGQADKADWGYADTPKRGHCTEVCRLVGCNRLRPLGIGDSEDGQGSGYASGAE